MATTSGSTSTAHAGAFVDRTYAPPQLKDEDSDGAVRSPVSGVIVGVEARAGDRVRRGQALATIEAMKMQYSILAPIDGVVQTSERGRRRPGAGAGDSVRHRTARRPLRWTKPSSPAR